METRTLAAIDIGTNTFRLLIADVVFNSRNNKFTIKEIHSERTITRLGEGLHDNRLLQDDAIDRSIEALLNYVDIIRKHGISHVSAIATSALREADNEPAFIARAKALTGLDIRVISGNDEGNITAAGMLLEMVTPETALLIDIGGGSTELILTQQGKPVKVHSLNLGVVYLAGKYMTNDPPLPKDLLLMEEEISEMTARFQELFADDIKNNTVMIGTAGTITTLSAVKQNLLNFSHDMIHNSSLKFNDIKNIFNKISTVTHSERTKHIPFEPERLDIIVPGTLILLELMKTFNFNRITVSDYGLREGILIDLYKSLNRPQ